MKVIAIANQKGGVGKTTTAVSLGGLLAKSGKRTLLVDIDPHGSMTSYFRYSPDDLEKSVYTLFQDTNISPQEVTLPTRFERLRLLPASMALATLDRQLGTKSGMGLVIKKALSQLSDQFDYAVIDCPPMLGVLMINALAACDQLVIPVQTEFLALKGLERMVNTLTMITRSRSVKLPYLIVPTLFDRRTRASTDALQTLRERYSQDLWDSVIPVDTQFREASKAGIPLPMMEPWARGVLAYRQLLETLIQKEKNTTRAVAI
jgi:chromosome partitioning protein